MQQSALQIPKCRSAVVCPVVCQEHRHPVRQPWRQFSVHEHNCYRSRRCCCRGVSNTTQSSHFDGTADSPQASPQDLNQDAQQDSISEFADMLRGSSTDSSSNGSSSNNGSRSDIDSKAVVPGLERAFLVGVARKGQKQKYTYTITESLEELGRLAETAGLEVRHISMLIHYLSCPMHMQHSKHWNQCYALYTSFMTGAYVARHRKYSKLASGCLQLPSCLWDLAMLACSVPCAGFVCSITCTCQQLAGMLAV